MTVTERKTKETDIRVELNVYGSGDTDIDTGIGFFDHMLNSFAVHGGFDLKLVCKGDLQVDGHHTVEDCGIVLGKAFADELGDKSGIARFGSAFIPMDEALSRCCVDISGRPFLVFDAQFSDEMCGDYANCLTEEFFRALCFNAGITLHINNLYGKNDHHKIESMFKSAAYALKQAVQKREGAGAVSTKGIL